MKKHINFILKLVGIATIVTLSWWGLELLILGEIKPNNIDSVIGVILTYSLYCNLSNWENKEKSEVINNVQHHKRIY
jgi:hypothetical protein